MKACQTDVAGLKGHLLILSNEEYSKKFEMVVVDQMVQTELDQEQFYEY